MRTVRTARTARTVMMTGDRRVDKPRLRRVVQTNDKRRSGRAVVPGHLDRSLVGY